MNILAQYVLALGIVTPTAIAIDTFYLKNTFITVAGQQLTTSFEIKDDIQMIQDKIDAGTATQAEITRKAVLIDRLHQMGYDWEGK